MIVQNKYNSKGSLPKENFVVGGENFGILLHLSINEIVYTVEGKVPLFHTRHI